MNDLTIHEYKIRIPGVSPKVIYHFSDVHLCTADEISTPEQCEEAQKQTEYWASLRFDFAKGHGEVYDSTHPVSVEEYFNQFIQTAEADGDALVIAGDLYDYISAPNARDYEKRFADLQLKHMLVRGNHESGTIPDDCLMGKIASPVQIIDLDDIIIAGFDDAERIITKEQIDILDSLLKQPKPLIIAMHIPIQTTSNDQHQLAGEYFRLNYAGAPEENSVFIDMICQNADRIAAVLCGHLHFLNVCELAPGLNQYVSSQGLLGNLNRYVIGE